MLVVDKVLRKFASHQDAESADRRYYRSLQPEQRLEILLELLATAQTHEAEQGFARVYRIVKLHGR